MNEDEVATTIEAFLQTINTERRFIDPTYKPLKSIIIANERAPTPVGSYAMVTMIGLVDNGEADHTDYREAVILSRSRDATVEELKAAPVEIERRFRSFLTKVRIDVFAGAASDYARILRGVFLSARAQTDLGCLMPRTIGDIESERVLVGQIWEGRARFEIELSGISRTETAIDVIESGRIRMTGTGSQTIETEFTYQKD